MPLLRKRLKFSHKSHPENFKHNKSGRPKNQLSGDFAVRPKNFKQSLFGIIFGSIFDTKKGASRASFSCENTRETKHSSVFRGPRKDSVSEHFLGNFLFPFRVPIETLSNNKSAPAAARLLKVFQ